MKINGPLLLTIGFLLAPTTWGDTLKLKDGTILEGTIVKDTPEEVVFSVEVRPGIREEKTFKGEDVAVVLQHVPKRPVVEVAAPREHILGDST